MQELFQLNSVDNLGTLTAEPAGLAGHHPHQRTPAALPTHRTHAATAMHMQHSFASSSSRTSGGCRSLLSQHRHHQHFTRVHPIRAEVVATAGKRAFAKPRKDVAVKLTATSFSSRKLQATVDIHAPLPIVWEALTDYDRLGTFIPSLVENKCLERRKGGCLLYQVGAQDVAMGIKFSAACTLEIKEYPSGIPSAMFTQKGDWSRYFPAPLNSAAGTATSTSSISSSISSYSSMDSMDEAAAAASTSGGSTTRDISFNLVAGDFQAFKGIWRLQPDGTDPSSTLLQYSLFVRPHPWLPVKLIEDRISCEVVNNLNAVRRYTERVHKQQQQQQQAQPGSAGNAFSSVDSSSSSMTGRSSSTVSNSSNSSVGSLGTVSVSSEEQT